MSAGTSEFFCLICLLICSCTAQKIIPAELGQDVILPCKVPNINNINDIAAVEWIRPGLDPEYVLLYRDGRFDPYNQHPSYQNRVDLQDKEMKNGDISLILKNVKMEDTGKYVCRVSKKGKIEPFSIINLKVYLSAQTIITAKRGQDVILPCKVPNNYNNITAVEWIRPDLDPEYVLLYRDGRFDPNSQHPSYQNRVDLQDKEMKDGDVSLILKNMKMEDKGIYECRVFEKGKNEPISIINLEVLPSDHSWKIIVGVVVPLVVIILSAVGFAVYKILQIRKMKKEKQEDIERLERKISETNNQLQQKTQENEDLKDEQVKLERSHSETSKLLQQEKERNEKAESGKKTLQDQLEELKGNNSETNIQLQQEKQKNEKAESDKKTLQDQLEELERSHSETSKLLQQEKERNEKAESDKKTLQDQLEELNIPDIISLLQQQEQENEALDNEMDKLMGNNPENISLLQKKKLKNKAPKNQQVELERSPSDPSIQFQQETQRNENLNSHLRRLDEMNSDTNSDPTGSDEENQQEEREQMDPYL